MIRIVAVTPENERLTNIRTDQIDFNQPYWWWIDFSQPTKEEISKLDTDFHFHPLAIEDCIHSLQRPKMDYYDDFNFLVTHTIEQDTLKGKEIDFFLGENFIVSFHHHDSPEVNQVWNRLNRSDGPNNWDEYRVLYEILDKVVDNYFPTVQKIEDELNTVEDNPDERPMDELLDELFDIRHNLLSLRHMINPVRDLFYRMLSSHHLPGVNERREYFADIYDHLIKLSEMVQSNREIANDIRDNFISYNSHQQNKVIQILTIITSIFAPLTFIAGIYGMNFEYMPELSWRYSYPAVWLVMITITAGMIAFFKRKNWF